MSDDFDEVQREERAEAYARAARIVRTALARNALTLDDLAPPRGESA